MIKNRHTSEQSINKLSKISNMKQYIIAICFILLFTTTKAQTRTITSAESISVTTEYINNMDMTWNVNGTDSTKPLLINYTIGTEYRWDYVNIYSIDIINGIETPVHLVSLSGIQSGTVSSVIPTGKVKITFTSDQSMCYQDNPFVFSGIQINFSVDSIYPASAFSNSYVSGNSIVNGNVGIGVLNPSYKLEVKGTAKILENIQLGSTISFLDNARFNVTRSNISNLGPNSFLMPQYGVAAPITGGSADFWISGNNNIRMFTAGNPTPRLSILNNGNVGIGTNNPSAKLEIKGDFLVKNGDNVFKYNGNGDVTLKYPVRGSGGRAMVHHNNNTLVLNYGNDFTGGIQIGNSILFKEGGISYINTGKIAIGLPNPQQALSNAPIDELLTVNGTIHAKEIRIDLTGSLADYVFEPDYTLMPLSEVESFVKANKHLPEIPSAAEVKENGLSMGEMQNKLLQKIEELTLYVIEQQKQLEIQRAEIDELKRKQ